MKLQSLLERLHFRLWQEGMSPDTNANAGLSLAGRKSVVIKIQRSSWEGSQLAAPLRFIEKALRGEALPTSYIIDRKKFGTLPCNDHPVSCET